MTSVACISWFLGAGVFRNLTIKVAPPGLEGLTDKAGQQLSIQSALKGKSYLSVPWSGIFLS